MVELNGSKHYPFAPIPIPIPYLPLLLFSCYFAVSIYIFIFSDIDVCSAYCVGELNMYKVFPSRDPISIPLSFYNKRKKLKPKKMKIRNCMGGGGGGGSSIKRNIINW